MNTCVTTFCRAAILSASLFLSARCGAAAEPTDRLSAVQLDALGLGGLTTISDAEGLRVRGSGGHVGGFSFSINLSGLIPSFSTNQYSSSTGPGSSISYSFPGSFLSLIFGSPSSGLATFGQGSSSFWGL